MAKILIVDDEDNIRASLKSALENRGHECVTAENFIRAQEFARLDYDLILLDVMLGDGSGLDLLEEILTRNPQQCVVMISGHADVDMAVNAIRTGAYDFIEKPISLDRILITIENASRASRLRGEKNRLADILYGELIGQSESIQSLRADIVKSAPRAKRFLVLGENGTGKELAAHMIHRHSRFADGPFIAVNCAALPSELIESELFGHTKGAFTGATRNRSGKFIEASGGTIFLDEISEMPPKAQAKILRAIETRQITPVGSDKPVEVDGNIVAASNRDLEHRISEGKFRQDLYYRLNVVTFHLSPLRERTEDIVLLSDYFLKKFAGESGDEPKRLTHPALRLLKQNSFSGNIRELKNLMERLNIYCDTQTISDNDIERFLPRRQLAPRTSLREAVVEFEQQYIRDAIGRHGGNKAAAARELGLERSHLYKKTRKRK